MLLAFLLVEHAEEALLLVESVSEVRADADLATAEHLRSLVDAFQLLSESRAGIPVPPELRSLLSSAYASSAQSSSLLDALLEVQAAATDFIVASLKSFVQSEAHSLWLRLECQDMSTRPAAPAPEDPRLILVAEDSVPVAKIVSRALFARGYTVELVSDGAEALKKLLAKEFTAALLDLNLPGMTGLDAVQAFREFEPLLIAQKRSRRRQIVICMTAFVDPSFEARAAHAGVDEFFRKPFDVQRVMDVVKRENALNRVLPGS